MISTELKSILVRKSIKQQDLQSVLGLSSKQAVNNKFAKNSWSAEDLIKVVTFLGGELIIRIDDQEIKLDEKHLEKPKNTEKSLDLDKLLSE